MDGRVRAAIAFINGNVDRKMTATEVAQTVRLSPAHLRELFKDATGKSILQYRRELRLRRAKHLLENTFLSVKEVAAGVGIESVSHFIRAFARAYQITPARYAERYRRAIERSERTNPRISS
jgi:transcriptional regulator GlxA family with amidase domain